VASVIEELDTWINKNYNNVTVFVFGVTLWCGDASEP
jgi:hypothetical protein